MQKERSKAAKYKEKSALYRNRSLLPISLASFCSIIGLLYILSYMQVQKERSKAAKDKEKYIRHIRVYTYAYIRHIRVYICRCRRSAARRPRTRRRVPLVRD